MKKALLLLFAFSVSITAIAGEQWECKKSSSQGYIEKISVQIDAVKNSSAGTIVDRYMSASETALTNQTSHGAKPRPYFLTGEITGWDSRYYTVRLEKTDAGKGFAEVVYDGDIDCIGNVAGREILDCEFE